MLVRRVHVDDTAVMVTGDAAREWMTIGQAFAARRARIRCAHEHVDR